MKQNDNRLLVTRIAIALGLPEVPPDFQGIDAVLPLLEHMREEGAVVVVKLDGQRTESGDAGPYTAVVSGGRLSAENHARVDARALEDALAFVIVHYARTGWRML